MAMSDEHKAALAKGRREAKVIKSYLKGLESKKPGRPVTAATVNQRIGTLEAKIEGETDPLRRVSLRQQRINAESKLTNASGSVDMAQLEKDFVANAKAFSKRKGITYSAWREAGVPPEVLVKAGIERTRRARV